MNAASPRQNLDDFLHDLGSVNVNVSIIQTSISSFLAEHVNPHGAWDSAATVQVTRCGHRNLNLDAVSPSGIEPLLYRAATALQLGSFEALCEAIMSGPHVNKAAKSKLSGNVLEKTISLIGQSRRVHSGLSEPDQEKVLKIDPCDINLYSSAKAARNALLHRSVKKMNRVAPEPLLVLQHKDLVEVSLCLQRVARRLCAASGLLKPDLAADIARRYGNQKESRRRNAASALLVQHYLLDVETVKIVLDYLGW